jgi:hypothetical protein
MGPLNFISGMGILEDQAVLEAVLLSDEVSH